MSNVEVERQRQKEMRNEELEIRNEKGIQK
jgi:hypothetical protein